MEKIEPILKLIDRYGVSVVMLALFLVATFYILQRLLAKKDGILTGYVSNTVEQQKLLTIAVDRNAITNEQMSRVLSVYDERLGIIEKTTEILATNYRIQENNSQSNLNLSSALNSMEKRYGHKRNEILVVDDDIVYLRLVDQAVSHSKNKMERFKYASITHVGTLAGALTHIYNAIVIILDVKMPGTDETDTRLFVSTFTQCPVIIYSADNHHKLEDFPGAFAVICKQQPLRVLTETIDRALQCSNPLGCE